MEKKYILVTTDQAGGIIHACPYCHRYVKREKGIKICLCCYGTVDNDRAINYRVRVNFDGGRSWRREHGCKA